MAAGAPSRQPVWERLREGRVGRWCRAVLLDYAAAVREAAGAARRGPARALAAAGLAAGLAGCARGCPDEAALEAALLEASGRLLLLSAATRSGRAEAHVGRLLALRAEGRLAVRGLGLLAVAYEAPAPPHAALYRARCPHLAPPPDALPGRLLDVGFAGTWWLLRARMRDCDVNPDEFRALPARLRRLSARHLHSARNERLFDQKFLPVRLPDPEPDPEQRRRRP